MNKGISRGSVIGQYILDNSLRLHPAQEKLVQATLKLPMGIMLGASDQVQLMQNLCRLIGAKKTLDVGVYTGYSALSIALVLPPNGRVVACDITDEHMKTVNSAQYFQEAGVAEKIQFRIGPALDTLKTLINDGESGTFDFAFVDADKENYPHYYELCLKLIRSGGIIAFDNTMLGGSVADPSDQRAWTVAVRQMNASLHHDERINLSFLAVGDGTTLCFKK